MLKIMAKNDIKTTDVSYIEVYDDFIELRKNLKFSAVITELSEKYNKGERTISRMMVKLQEYLII
jgi:dimeric dUTPase (all-alpha-NTP-PPase superfamily)